MTTLQPTEPDLLPQESDSRLSDELLLAICESVNVIACECPGYLVKLLREVKKFRLYTQSCKEHFPENADVHDWLGKQITSVESLLTLTMIEFLHKEELLDEKGRLNSDALLDRVRLASLKSL